MSCKYHRIAPVPTVIRGWNGDLFTKNSYQHMRYKCASAILYYLISCHFCVMDDSFQDQTYLEWLSWFSWFPVFASAFFGPAGVHQFTTVPQYLLDHLTQVLKYPSIGCLQTMPKSQVSLSIYIYILIIVLHIYIYISIITYYYYHYYYYYDK